MCTCTGQGVFERLNVVGLCDSSSSRKCGEFDREGRAGGAGGEEREREKLGRREKRECREGGEKMVVRRGEGETSRFGILFLFLLPTTA